MSWDDVGDVVHQAIARASGLPVEKVVWKDQNVNAPAAPYATIRLTSMIPEGIDYLSVSQDLTRPRGEEVKIETSGTREVGIEVECFTVESISGREAAALAQVSKIYSGLLLPSVRAILDSQDVSIFDVGPINWIPDVPSIKFRGRAMATLRSYMPAPTVAEYVGFIERFSGTVTIKGGTGGDVNQDFDVRAEVAGEED